MALVLSSIAEVCRGLADYLGDQFSDTDTPLQVRLGSPAEVAAEAPEDEHRLCVFFFRFEPSGYYPDTAPGDTHYLRAHSLITPMAIAENGTGKGENDLRILGEVMRILQEKPVFELTIDGQSFHLQAVFQTLGLDQINQIWSTQGDTTYRPSVLYEFSLAPVIPNTPAPTAPLASAVGVGIRGGDHPPQPVIAVPPPVRHWQPDISQEAWAPAVAWVYESTLAQSLSFALGSDALSGFTPQLWVVGKPGTDVTFSWDLWESGTGWQRDHTDGAGTIVDAQLDSEHIDQATPIELTLPFNDRPGQLVLYAEREFSRASDGHPLRIRSNPLIINLYEAQP